MVTVDGHVTGGNVVLDGSVVPVTATNLFPVREAAFVDHFHVGDTDFDAVVVQQRSVSLGGHVWVGIDVQRW